MLLFFFVKTIMTNLEKLTNAIPQVTCVINIENWSKWLLDDPVYYIKYGAFRPSKYLFSFKCLPEQFLEFTLKRDVEWIFKRLDV